MGIGPPRLSSVRVPIACRLTAGAARSQLDEWRQVATAHVGAVERVAPTQLRLRLGDLVGLDTVVRLAQREKACCPFFDFALDIEAETVFLRVTVPEDAASILDDFSRVLAEATSR
jgi:hypothetical protein